MKSEHSISRAFALSVLFATWIASTFGQSTCLFPDSSAIIELTGEWELEFVEDGQAFYSNDSSEIFLISLKRSVRPHFAGLDSEFIRHKLSKEQLQNVVAYCMPGMEIWREEGWHIDGRDIVVMVVMARSPGNEKYVILGQYWLREGVDVFMVEVTAFTSEPNEPGQFDMVLGNLKRIGS